MAAELVERASEAVGRFIAWLDRFGELSQDAHDFWAFDTGRRAKALYYRHRITGTVATAPFVFASVVAVGPAPRSVTPFHSSA